MTDLGPLNRRGALYRNDPTAAVGGAPVDNLTPLRNLYLTVVESEDSDAEVIATRVSENVDIVWKSRWFLVLATDMFITFEGETFRIKSRKEIGRRHGWLIAGTLVR